MKSIYRYTGTIAVTALIAGALAVYLFPPSADAQPAPTVQPADKGAAAGPSGVDKDAPARGSGSAEAMPAAGSAAGSGSDAGSAAGSGSDAGSAAGSGSAMPAAGSGSDAGSGAGSDATPPAPPKPPITAVSCDTVTAEKTLKGPADAEVSANGVIKFQTSSDIQPDSAASAGFEVKGGTTTCLRFVNEGTFTYHSANGQHGAITVRQWYDILASHQVEDLTGGNFWMPKAVNLTADESDLMFYAVLGLSAFFFAAIAGAVIYFVIKYRHRPGHKPEPSAAHNDALEITWTVIPTLICVFLFYYGWRTYVRVVTPPTKAVEINVLAWRWNWQFTHSNGVQDSDLHVPVNTPVRLVMTSKDVLHSFYAPVMRVKQDVVPRRYTYAWFFPTKPGVYRLTCAEYCGTDHSQMACQARNPDGSCARRAVLIVHQPGDYERYLSDKASLSLTMNPIDLGKMLYEKKGCNACHTTDGSTRVGPTWSSKDWGKMIGLADGSNVKLDENYIRESIMYPQAKSRPGYPPSMPSFEGQLKEKELEGLIQYIKSLKK